MPYNGQFDPVKSDPLSVCLFLAASLTQSHRFSRKSEGSHRTVFLPVPTLELLQLPFPHTVPGSVGGKGGWHMVLAGGVPLLSLASVLRVGCLLAFGCSPSPLSGPMSLQVFASDI